MNISNAGQEEIVSATMPLSKNLSLVSDETGIVYDIMISEPKCVLIADVPDPPASLLYVVDGPLHGGLAASIARNLSLWFPGEQNTQPVTVVSIGPRISTSGEFADYLHKGQVRDLVPRNDPAGNEASSAQQFLDFLYRQVDPAVRKSTRTLNEKALIFGHGLSGLFACHAFATQHPMFDRYIIASPTLLDDSPTRDAIIRASKGQLGGHLYLAMSADDRLDGPRPRVEGAIGRSFHQLAALTGRRHRPQLRAKVEVLADESFQSQIPAALINGLRWHLPSTGRNGWRMIRRNLPGYFQIILGFILNMRRAKRQQKEREAQA